MPNQSLSTSRIYRLSRVSYLQICYQRLCVTQVRMCTLGPEWVLRENHRAKYWWKSPQVSPVPCHWDQVSINAKLLWQCTGAPLLTRVITLTVSLYTCLSLFTGVTRFTVQKLLRAIISRVYPYIVYPVFQEAYTIYPCLPRLPTIHVYQGSFISLPRLSSTLQ